MSVIGMNIASLTRQADSYTAVGTTQSTGQTGAMNFASLMAGMMNGQLNTKDQSDAGVIRANTDNRAQGATNAEDGIKKSSVGLQKTSFSGAGNGKQNISGMKASNDNVSDEDCKKAMEVVASVLGQFAEILGVSVEELEGYFEELGIDISEMLNTDNIAKLVLLLNGGEDISDMLMDEDMLGSFNDLMKAVDSILEEAGMDRDEFSQVTASDIFDAMTKETETKNPVDILKKYEASEDKYVEDKTAEPEEKDISVTCTKAKEAEDASEGKSKEDSTGTDTSSDRRTARTLDDGANTSTNVTGVNGFINSMQNAVKSTSLDNMLAEMGTSVRDIVFQLTDAIKVNIGGDNTSLEMQLTPENLGRVHINISSKDGVMTAHITTENQTAREAIESQLQILKDHITEQGFKVDAIEVSVSNFSFTDSRNAAHSDEEQDQPTQKGGHRAIGSVEETGSTDVAEDIRREVMLQTGSTVSYVA